QRDRVRVDAGVRGGARHHEERELEGPAGRAAVRPRPRGHCGAVAPRLRRQLLAPGPHGAGARREPDPLGLHRRRRGLRRGTLDAWANDVVVRALEETGLVGALVSEELDEPLRPATRGGRVRYVVCVDPVDGSSNLDVNGIVGTIFSIRRSAAAGNDTRQPGTAQVAAGYIMYGPATLMVLTTGDGVDGFTLDPTSGEFVRTMSV